MNAIMQRKCVCPFIARVTGFIFRISFRCLMFTCALALLSTSVPGALLAQQIQRDPWRGQPGITESVATIMAREKASPARPKSVQVKKAGRGSDVRKDHPDAPAVSQWPPAGS